MQRAKTTFINCLPNNFLQLYLLPSKWKYLLNGVMFLRSVVFNHNMIEICSVERLKPLVYLLCGPVQGKGRSPQI